MREEGDVVHLDETFVDFGFVGEDIETGREELKQVTEVQYVSCVR